MYISFSGSQKNVNRIKVKLNEIRREYFNNIGWNYLNCGITQSPHDAYFRHLGYNGIDTNFPLIAIYSDSQDIAETVERQMEEAHTG